MAKECENCGKKIGVMGLPQGVKFSGRIFSVCSSCYKMMMRTKIMLDENDEMLYQKNKREIENSFSENLYSDEVKSSIKDYLIACDERVKENKIKQQENNAEQQKQAENLKNYLLSYNKMKMTTGHNFEGYKIMEYIDVVSGESVLGTGFISELSASVSDVFGTFDNTFSRKMRVAKDDAVKKLKVSAAQIGANAVIGVDFDYITFSNNILGVSANATAVIIEKIDEA